MHVPVQPDSFITNIHICKRTGFLKMWFPFQTGSLADCWLNHTEEVTYLHTKKVSAGQSALRDEFTAVCNWSIRIREKAAILLSLYL